MANESAPSLIILKVKSLPEIEDRKVSKNETQCLICQCPFAKKGASQSQKHVCRFCYHAVCSACSPLTAIHPETNESERICLTCYTHYLRVFIEEQDAPKLEELIESEISKFREESLETYTKELEKMREEHRKRELALHEQVHRLNSEIDEKDSKINDLSSNHEKNKEENDNKNKESIKKFANEIKDIEIQNQQLKKEIETLKENQRRVVTPAQRSGCLKSCVVF